MKRINLPVIIVAALLALSACTQQNERMSPAQRREINEANAEVRREKIEASRSKSFIAISGNVFRVYIGENEKKFFLETGCEAISVDSVVGYKDHEGEALMTYVCEPSSVAEWNRTNPAPTAP